MAAIIASNIDNEHVKLVLMHRGNSTVTIFLLIAIVNRSSHQPSEGGHKYLRIGWDGLRWLESHKRYDPSSNHNTFIYSDQICYSKRGTGETYWDLHVDKSKKLDHYAMCRQPKKITLKIFGSKHKK